MTNEEIIQIGKRIKNLRKERNLSQEEVAKQMDISRQAVTRWENGRTLPSSGHVIKLADLFGVPVELLTGGNKQSELGSLSTKKEQNVATVIEVLSLKEIQEEIKAEIKKRLWSIKLFLLTILFFTMCWFFDTYLGWDVYVWCYIEKYFYAWSACLLIFIGGILQKRYFVASICSGSVLTVLVGQFIALYSKRHSLLLFNESWMALIVFWNLSVMVGLLLEYRMKKKSWKKKTMAVLFCIVILFFGGSILGFHCKYTYNQGAKEGYLAGYKAGVANAKTGEGIKEEKYAEDCLAHWEKYNVGESTLTVLRHKGFFMHWDIGYNAGYKKGGKEG